MEDQTHEEIKRKIEEIMKLIAFPVTVEVGSHPEISSLYVNITMHDARLFIGSHEANLLAFEYLMKRILEKGKGEPQKIFLDVNSHRFHRLEILKEEAKQVAKKVTQQTKIRFQLHIYSLSGFNSLALNHIRFA